MLNENEQKYKTKKRASKLADKLNMVMNCEKQLNERYIDNLDLVTNNH